MATKPHIGSWGTRDYGITEAVSKLLGIPLGNQGQSIINAPQPREILPVGFQSGEDIARARAAGTLRTPGYPNGVPTNNVLGLNTTGGGSGGSGGAAPSNFSDLGSQLAESETDRRIRMIRELFDQGKEQVQAYRGNIQSRFDDIMKAVGGFRERAGTLRDNAGQEIINRGADILGSNAKTAQELAGSANAQGRNLGLSSKVKLGQKLLGNLQTTQGNTLARRGEEDRSNQALYQEREDQAASQERDANTARSAGLEQADLYDRQNLANFGDNYEGAQLNFATLLNNILGKSEALTAMKAPDAGSLSAYNPNFGGIVNTINGVLSGSGAGGDGGPSVEAANLANPQTYADYLKKIRGLYTG